MGSFNTKDAKRKMSAFGLTVNVETALQKELDDQKLRYKPESLHLLTEQTHFSEKELKYLYQCFKQNCPSGYVAKAQFIQIYRGFFNITRNADASEYAELVFNTFDDDDNGRISFSEFVQILSMFVKGSLEQRLDWLFDLYDSRHKGFIVEEDYFRVCRAMYSMVGCHFIRDKMFPMPIKRHIKHRFAKLDKNRDGKITRQEFLDGCMNDKNIVSQMDTLRAVF